MQIPYVRHVGQYSQTMLLMPLNFAANRLWSVGWYSGGGTPVNTLTGAGLVIHALFKTPVLTAAVGSGPYLAAATQLEVEISGVSSIIR